MSVSMPNVNVEVETPTSPIHGRDSRRLLSVAALLALAFFALSTANAQMPAAQNGSRGRVQGPQMGIPPAVGPNGEFQARRIRQLNIERQKEMVSDTDNLLKLTEQLNADVAKNHSSSLTPDQVRMLARIEKLAKSVREKMSNPVQGSVFENNFPPPMGGSPIP